MTKLLVLTLLAAACGKSNDKPGPPYTGPLTLERIRTQEPRADNRGAVQVCDETWELSFARLQAVLGPPTAVEGAYQVWYAAEGDRCAIYKAEKGECPPSWNKPGDRLAMTAFGEHAKGDSPYDDCVAKAPKR